MAPKKPDAALFERMSADAAQPKSDAALEKLRDKARELQEEEHVVLDLTQQLEDAKGRVTQLKTKDLPAMFEEAQVKSLDVLAHGNYPGFKISVKPFVTASLPVSMEEHLREEGFEELIECGGGDLIKTTISFEFPKDSEELWQKFLGRVDALSKQDGMRSLPIPQVKMTVNHASLAKWLREEIEAVGKSNGDLRMPDLKKLNAFVGTTTELKVEKEK
jgi:hypothetical protein